jgi:hypothetical protein
MLDDKHSGSASQVANEKSVQLVSIAELRQQNFAITAFHNQSEVQLDPRILADELVTL